MELRLENSLKEDELQLAEMVLQDLYRAGEMGMGMSEGKNYSHMRDTYSPSMASSREVYLGESRGDFKGNTNRRHSLLQDVCDSQLG